MNDEAEFCKKLLDEAQAEIRTLRSLLREVVDSHELSSTHLVERILNVVGV